MRVKLWGVRGSLPAPMMNEEYSAKIRSILENAVDYGLTDRSSIDSFMTELPDYLKQLYGGNTTCTTVETDEGELFIIDCGTGIRPLGYKLMKGACGRGEGDLKIFLTHNHWDHIQGLPFFVPIYVKGNKINFYSPYKNQREILNRQMEPPCFPAAFEGTLSEKIYHSIDMKKREPLQFKGGMRIDLFPLKHPGGSFAYRFRQNGKTFIFATDAEFTGESLDSSNTEMHAFFEEADLLVLDSQYTLDESFSKFDWGHTSITMSVNCGIRWRIKKLVMTHHEPAYTDEILHENYLTALDHRNISGHTEPEIVLATEGMEFEL